MCGLYNLVNNETITKHDMLVLFKRFFNKNVNIEKNNKVKLAKVLVNTRKDFSFTVPSYEEMIREMAEWVNTHKKLYSHYFI